MDALQILSRDEMKLIKAGETTYCNISGSVVECTPGNNPDPLLACTDICADYAASTGQTCEGCWQTFEESP